MRSNCRSVHALVTLAALGTIGAMLGPSLQEVRAERAGAGAVPREKMPEAEASEVEMYGVETEEELPREAEETTEPGEMIEAEPERERYRVIVRPSLWIPWSSTKFWYYDKASEFSLESDFDVPSLKLLLPIEAFVRTEGTEFRLRYVVWTSEDSELISGTPLVFGSASFAPGERVKASLATHSLGLSVLQRILEKPLFDLYIAAEADLFYTSLELSGASGSDKLQETLPILSVGLGLRFNLRSDLSLFLSHSALSYSQLLFLDEEFFGNRDVYRNVEVAIMWEKTDRLDLGAGWRHYDVSFKSDRLKASQVMSGASCWVRFKF